jgi:predicted nucleic acid-binding protein
MFESIAIQYAKPNLANALKIAHRTKLCAYDAYFLDCAIRHDASLVTLDRRLAMAARALNVAVPEV